MAEKAIYDDGKIKITTARVVIGGSTYQLRNISSIRVVYEVKGWVVLMALVGALSIIVGFADISKNGICIPFGIGLIFLAFKIGFENHFIYFDTNAGSVSAYKGRKEKCFQIKDTIEEAMAEA